MPKIVSVRVRDIRYPTSLGGHGSDAMHTDPDYSCAYVELNTSDGLTGFGHTFTIGRGTDIVVHAAQTLGDQLVVGREDTEIFQDMGKFAHQLSNESQMRWLGPEKGVMHLALAAVLNALWDIWAKRERKPLWKLLVDLDPEVLVATLDFTYITDALTPDEAIKILKSMRSGIQERETEMRANGHPAYCTSVGWLNYSDEQIRNNCRQALSEGWTRFKAKVGANLEDDKRRMKIIREEIGYQNLLMVDANQRWEVSQAIDWMRALAEFKPLWIEEPVFPDDVLGHKTISDALKPLGIQVATGEQCANRVLFKQFFTSGALYFAQPDATRLAGINEAVTVILLAKKYNIPVCPHAGGVGLCEINQHLAFFDYIAVAGTLKDRMFEFADHLHEHYKHPVKMHKDNYLAPLDPGNCCEMFEQSVAAYEYPNGSYWKERLAS